jgi:hypothetical protein
VPQLEMGRSSVVSLAAVMLLGCGGSASGLSPSFARQHPRPRTILTGAIYFVGGPPPQARRSPEAGWVHVVDVHQRAVALVHVRRNHHFRVTLPPGTYNVEASQVREGSSLGCAPELLHLRAGRETRVKLSVGCLVP